MWLTICNTSISATSVPLTSSQAETYLPFKNSEKQIISHRFNIERNNGFRLSFQCQCIDTLCTSSFHQNEKRFPKGSLPNLQMFYAKHYNSTNSDKYKKDPIMLEARKLLRKR